MVFQLIQEQLKKNNLFLQLKEKIMMEINLLKNAFKKGAGCIIFFKKY